MRRTNIYLDDEQINRLDRLAATRGAWRAAVIRDLIDRGLDGANRSLTGDVAAIDASFAARRGGVTDFERPGENARAPHLAETWER